jgi:hypothetical protein
MAEAGEAIKRSMVASERYAEAGKKYSRLIGFALVSMPQCRAHPDMPMKEVLHRWWPGGRAA